jgi:hypothetical protein
VILATLVAAIALATTPAGEAEADPFDAEARSAREDRARIAGQIAKIEAFRASLSLPADAAADGRAARALEASQDALAKAEARLRDAERRRDAEAAVAAWQGAARCALAPLQDALREHGQSAVELGAELAREVETALAAMRRRLAPAEDEVVTASRDLQKTRGGELQAVADVLVVRSGATGEVRLQVRYSVGRPGEAAEDSSILVLEPSGRLKGGEMARSVRSCLDGRSAR